MKTPDDIHISEKDCRFADCGLPTDAVLYGFTIDSDSEKSNERISAKLQALEKWSPEEIVLDGVISRVECHKNGGSQSEKRVVSPFASFVSAFAKKIDLIVKRLDRMLELQNATDGRSLDWLTYRDMVIVQIAAMTVDEQANKKGGYTIQSLLARIGQQHLIVEIDKVLNKVIAVDAQHNEVTVRAALRIVRNRFLCHYDNHECYDWCGNDKETFWSLSDMFVLERLLLPPVTEPIREGSVRELMRAICQTFSMAITSARWQMFIGAACSDKKDNKVV